MEGEYSYVLPQDLNAGKIMPRRRNNPEPLAHSKPLNADCSRVEKAFKGIVITNVHLGS
jgi:hypothetical protein